MFFAAVKRLIPIGYGCVAAASRRWGIHCLAGFVLNKLKQQQTYAVLDLSDAKIGPKIERQARTSDMDALARLLAKDEQFTGKLLELQRELGPELTKLRPKTEGEAPEKISFDRKVIDLPHIRRPSRVSGFQFCICHYGVLTRFAPPHSLRPRPTESYTRRAGP